MGRKLYRLAILFIMLGAGGMLITELDPIYGIGMVLLTAGAVLLREVGSGR